MINTSIFDGNFFRSKLRNVFYKSPLSAVSVCAQTCDFQFEIGIRTRYALLML